MWQRSGKPLVYNMRPEGCQETEPFTGSPDDFPQVIDFKLVSTYTSAMNRRRVFSAVFLAALCTAAIGSRALFVEARSTSPDQQAPQPQTPQQPQSQPPPSAD